MLRGFAIAAAMMVGMPAAASVVEITFTGTLNDGMNMDPSGEAVVVSYSYETKIGTLTTYTGGQTLDGPMTSTVWFEGDEWATADDDAFASVFNDPGEIYGKSQYFGAGVGIKCIDDSDILPTRLDVAYYYPALCSGSFSAGGIAHDATFYSLSFNVLPSPVPLPASAALLLAGLGCLGGLKRRTYTTCGKANNAA